jgi:phosphatidylserine/phosphatidylglycerophosphate/cardiolipin synthase-like enzyme
LQILVVAVWQAEACVAVCANACNEAVLWCTHAMGLSTATRCQRGAEIHSHLLPRDCCCRLLHVLRGAQRTLDVCVFTITCDEIADALIQAHQRGVRVRIISDNDQVCRA